MSQTTQQRRQGIVADVYEHGRVLVRDLVEQLGVSEATIRRDLKALSAEGKVELVYGGAMLPRRSDFSFRAKEVLHVEAKRIIGRLAADLVEDGDLVFLDSGTTCFSMVPYLSPRRGVSIIVNSARLALELDSPDLDVILLGGQYRPERMDTIGPLAMASLDQLRGYTAFLGADGLGMDFGVSASDIDSAHLYRQALTRAREAVLVVDHSKFLSPSLFRIADFDAFGRVVTDRRPPESWMAYLDGKGVDVMYPREAETGNHPSASATQSATADSSQPSQE